MSYGEPTISCSIASLFYFLSPIVLFAQVLTDYAINMAIHTITWPSLPTSWATDVQI
jgi:hypothetical protein